MYPPTGAEAPERVAAVLRVAAGYTRQSKVKADESEASPQVQDDATEKCARERGCSFRGHYRDIGVSGCDPKAKRKQFDRLVSDCRAGRVHEIVVYDVTRFSRREPKDAIPIVLELLGLGVTVTSVSEGSFSPGDATELVMLLMRLDAARQDGRGRSRTISGVRRAAKEPGGWTGGAPPYGMESYPVRVVRNAGGGEATVTVRRLRPASVKEDGTDQAGEVLGVVNRIFEYKDKPWTGKRNAHPASVGAVVAWLNSRGVRTQNGGLWRERAVKRLLSDPRLAGIAAEPVYALDKTGTPTRNVSGYRILRDENDEPIVIGDALIPRPSFFELQDWLTGRGRAPRGGTPSRYLLTAMGKLYCECGRPMTGSRDVYKCSRPAGVVEPGKHTGGSTVQQEAVDAFVASRILAVVLNADAGDPGMREVIAEVTARFAQLAEGPERRSERSALLGERAGVVRSIEQLYDDLKLGVYDGTVGRSRFLLDKQSLEGRLTGLDARVRDIGGPEPPPLPLEEWGRSDDGDPVGPTSWWGRAGIEDRRMMVGLFVDRVTVAKSSGRGGLRNLRDAMDRVTVEMASGSADGG